MVKNVFFIVSKAVLFEKCDWKIIDRSLVTEVCGIARVNIQIGCMKNIIALLVIVVGLSCKKQSGGGGIVVPDPPDTALVKNSSFENDNAEIQNPQKWLSVGDVDADLVATGGSNGKFALNHKKNAAYQVTTYQDISSLSDGYYTLTAQVKNSGGQDACYIAITAGGKDYITSLPVTNTWTSLTIRGVHVIDGKCTLKIYSDANAGNWCAVDALSLVKDDNAYTFLKGVHFPSITCTPRMVKLVQVFVTGRLVI